MFLNPDPPDIIVHISVCLSSGLDSVPPGTCIAPPDLICPFLDRSVGKERSLCSDTMAFAFPVTSHDEVCYTKTYSKSHFQTLFKWFKLSFICKLFAVFSPNLQADRNAYGGRLIVNHIKYFEQPFWSAHSWTKSVLDEHRSIWFQTKLFFLCHFVLIFFCLVWNWI